MTALTRLARLWPRSTVTTPARLAYALWSETYPPWPHNPLMAIEQRVVSALVASLAPVRALDVGTGTGRNLRLLADAGASVVVGLDFSLPMLARSVEYGMAGSPVCADASQLPFADGSFDLVTSSLMAGDVVDPSTWVKEAARVLRAGGHMVYSDFHPSWAAGRWRRTFRTAAGREAEIAYTPHSIEQHLEAITAASLEVRTIREPRLGADAPAGMRGDLPVAAIFHAVKRRAQ